MAGNRDSRRDDENEAPWLAEAGDRPRTDVSKRSLFWTLLVLLSLVTAIAVGLFLLLSKKDGGSTQGYMNAEQAPLITAEPGPYKVPPLDPKGLAVEGQDQTIYAAGEGIDAGSVIDPNAGPEAPLPRPGTAPGLPQDLIPPDGTTPPTSAAPPAATTAAPAIPPAAMPRTTPVPSSAPAAKPAAPPPKPAIAPAKSAATPPKPMTTPAATTAATPRPAPAKAGGVVQLGAFSSLEKANAAWATLSAKYAISGFAKRILVVEVDGRTLYRLRGSGGDAAELCRKVKAGGDPCTQVE